MVFDNDNMPESFYQPGDADSIQRRLECIDITIQQFHLTPKDLKVIENVRAQWHWHLHHAQKANEPTS